MMKTGGCHACETCFQTGKECALIACCEEADQTVLDGVLNVGDIDKTDGCKMAAALADKI